MKNTVITEFCRGPLYFPDLFGYDNRRHIGTNEFHSLSWLSVPERVTFFKLVLLLKIRNDLAPRYLVPNFVSISDTHSHNTRGSNLNFRLPRSLSLAPTTFAFTAIKDWNSLPNFVKEINALSSFKRKLKEYLLSRYT